MRRCLSLLLFLVLVAPAAAQDMRITEFLATNSNGIRDEDGDASPWIEIWNPNVISKYSLTGWKLTDGTTQWTFPGIEIMPDERIIVWASGKNRTVVTAPLHTNFTIPAAGGTLTLLRSTGSTASQHSAYPQQQPNVSWGRDDTDASTIATLVGRYTTPSPGERNNYSGPGVAGKVVIDKQSQAFTGSIVVTLSQASPDPAAQIRYTVSTTGAMPTVNSPIYTAPVTLASASLILRARVFKSGLLPGETETRAYLLLDATTSGFSSPMPILVVSNFGAGQPPESGDQNSFIWLWAPAPPDNRARFTNPPTLTSRTVIDRRGSSTLNNPKYNVNLEARKARNDDDRDVSILGMAEGSDYVLSGPYEFDRSDLHNPFIYGLSRSIDRYAPDTRQVEVFFDVNSGALNAPNSNSNDYFGIYNLMEKIRRDKHRVAVTKLATYDNDAVKITGGYLFKVDRRDAGDSGFSAGGQTMAYYNPKELDIKSPQRDPQEQYLTGYINNFNSVLQSGSWNHPTIGYAAYLDVPAAIDHHLLNVWAFNVDALRLSGYWFKERGGKLVPGPIWDFDRALSSTDGRDSNPAVWRSQSGDLGTDFFNYTWWNRLFVDIEFYQKYIDRWQQLRRDAFSPASVNALLDSLNADIAADAVVRDVTRWGKGKRSWTSPFDGQNYPASQDAEIQRMKDWLQQRANFMDSQWVTPVTASRGDGNVPPGTQLTLSVPNPTGVTIYYTLNGSDPRPSGGAAPGAGNVFSYAGPISINSTTRIRARAYKPSHTALTGANNPPLVSRWSGVTSVRLATDAPAATGDLVITEIHYNPAPATPAELAVNPFFTDLDFEFLELRNIGSTPIDLAGVHFTAGISFTFSGENALSLAPGAFVVVAANPQAFAARYGASTTVVGPFSGTLSDGGELLTFKAADASTIQSFPYDDRWYPATDGGGYSLVLYDVRTGAATLTTQANWRQSAAYGGSPGAAEPNAAPSVHAGPDTEGLLSGIALFGTAVDDSMPDPPRAFTLAWSKVTGPGLAIFSNPDAGATSVSFSLPGVYTLRLSANDSALTGTADIQVAAKDTAEAWLARHPGIGSLTDDFDRDSLSNYGEFALGMDPSLPNPVATTTYVEAGFLTLVYSRIKPPSEVTYSVEVSDDGLAYRMPNPGEVTEALMTDDGIRQTVKVTDSVPVGGQAKRFMRLKMHTP